MLGCGAHLAGLRRTATGGFGIADAVTLEDLEAMSAAERDAALRPAAVLLHDLPSLKLAAAEAGRFRQGAAVLAPGLADGACAAFAGEELLGVADIVAGMALPRRVVATSAAAIDQHG